MITGPTAATLADVWPEVASRLGRMLRHRGVDQATAEDVVQETAVRVLRAGVWFEDADDLFRWAAVVAWRVAVDASRKQRRVELAPVPDRPAPTNVALQVEHRSAVEAVGAGLRRLSPSDRQALLEAPPAATVLTRQEAVRLNVRRHRARARLMALLEGVVGVIGWLAARRQPRVGRVAAVSAAFVIPVLSAALLLVPEVADTPTRPTEVVGSPPVPLPATPPVPAPAP